MKVPRSGEARYTMKVVVRRTGLTPHVVRAWERRYGVPSPQRTETNRRLYTEADIERLRLLARATRAGHSIGQIFDLDVGRLTELVQLDEESGLGRSGVWIPSSSRARSVLDESLRAVAELDARSLERTLARASVTLGSAQTIEQVLVPLMSTIGDRWSDGSLRIAHEHLASSIVRSFVGNLVDGHTRPNSAPHLVFATPAGQRHELGALAAAVAAVSQGCRVTYLGADLPAAEIALTAEGNSAAIVALSIIYPADDPRLFEELKRLRGFLPESVEILAGGRAAPAYGAVLDQIGARQFSELKDFRQTLEQIRINHTGS